MGGSLRDNTPGFAPGTDDESPLGDLARTTADDLDLADEAMRARLSQRMFGGDKLPPSIGRFAIRRRVGSGGMGAVYEAHDPDLDRSVALKLLHGDLREEHQVRLRREAQALARIRHQNVVRVFEVGNHHGRLFLAMELVDGVSLQRWQQDATPSWREIVRVYAEAGDGLAAAHAAGLVHRDFKPSNVMVREDGSVQVLDFGLARELEPESATHGEAPATDTERGLVVPTVLNTRVTVTGTALGTPLYMSPEQMLGQPVDAASDQFSFCVALFEALYGEHPFGGTSSNELCQRMLDYELRPTPSGPAPRRLGNILARGLCPRREDRYADMATLLSALRRSFGRRWAPVGVAAAAVVVAGGAAAASNGGAPPCESRAALSAATWDAGAKQRIEARLQDHGYGVSYPGVDQKLSAWAESWATHYAEACAAGPESAARVGCLEQQLQSVESMVSFLDSDDPSIAARASFIVHEVPSAIQCLESDQRASDRDAAAALYLARLALSAADYPVAIQRAQEQLDSATASGDKRLLGEARLVMGEIAAAQYDLDGLQEHLRAAAGLGLAIDAPQLTVDAWTELALPLIEQAGEFDEARRLHGLATNLLSQLPATGSRAARLTYVDGALLTATGQHDQAVTALTEARRELERTAAPDAPVFVDLDTLLASARCELGEAERALGDFARLHQSVGERGTTDLARLASVEYFWGACAANQRDNPSAERLATAALDHLEDAGASAPSRTVDTLALLSEACDDQGKSDAAMSAADRAVELASREIPRTISHHRALMVRATALQNFDRYTEALADVETGLALRASLGLERADSNEEIGHLVLAFYADDLDKCRSLAKTYAPAFARRPEPVKRILEAFAEHHDQYPQFLAATGLDPLAFGAPPLPAG